MTDNWYIGINGGMNAKTTHTSIFQNLNPSAGLRIGRNVTPVLGLAVEGDVYFNNRGSEFSPLGTFVKGLNISLSRSSERPISAISSADIPEAPASLR